MPSDEELMQQAIQGNLQAFGMLFDRHQPALCAFLCRFLGEAAAAEDVAQEAFWRAWQYRGSFDGARGFSTWLYTIARHAAVDEIRRRGSRAAPLAELQEVQRERYEAHPDGRPAPEQVVLRDVELRRQVQEALQALPADQRTCLVLKEYEGRSYREIGEILGCSEGSARVMAHRARRALRGLLQPLPESEEPCAR